jgi:hypothetical protein
MKQGGNFEEKQKQEDREIPGELKKDMPSEAQEKDEIL